jgi:hypothetical protein
MPLTKGTRLVSQRLNFMATLAGLCILKRVGNTGMREIKAGNFFYMPIIKGSTQMHWYLFVNYGNLWRNPSGKALSCVAVGNNVPMSAHHPHQDEIGDFVWSKKYSREFHCFGTAVHRKPPDSDPCFFCRSPVSDAQFLLTQHWDHFPTNLSKFAHFIRYLPGTWCGGTSVADLGYGVFLTPGSRNPNPYFWELIDNFFG